MAKRKKRKRTTKKRKTRKSRARKTRKKRSTRSKKGWSPAKTRRYKVARRALINKFNRE